MMKASFQGIAAAMILAACGCGSGSAAGNAQAASAAAPEEAPGETVELRFNANGLGTGPAGLHTNRILAFGEPQADVLAAIAAIRGAPTDRGRNEECGAGPMEFVRFGNLVLNFQEDRFVGWFLDGPPGDAPIRDGFGFGLGTTRADLVGSEQFDVAIEESTLGVEFDAEGIGGLLSSDAPDATVTALWAGTTCFFR